MGDSCLLMRTSVLDFIFSYSRESEPGSDYRTVTQEQQQEKITTIRTHAQGT